MNVNRAAEGLEEPLAAVRHGHAHEVHPAATAAAATAAITSSAEAVPLELVRGGDEVRHGVMKLAGPPGARCSVGS